MAAVWHRPFGENEAVAGEMRWLLAVLGTNLAFAFPFGIYKTVLVGAGSVSRCQRDSNSSLLLRNALLVGCVYYECTLQAIGFAITAGSLMDHVCSAVSAYHYLPGLRFSWRFVDRVTLRDIRGYSSMVFLTYIAYRIATESNPLIVGAFLTPVAVTYFGIALTLSNQAGDGLRTAIAVLTPTISRWDALGAEDAVSRLFIVGTKYLLFLAAQIHVGLILLGQPFLTLWMGPRYSDACYPVLVILALPLPAVLAGDGRENSRGPG